MKFSTSLLRYFTSVCRERSFSQAALKVGKSQAAVSSQMALLEHDLGLKLFDRSKRPLALTEAGRIFLQFATGVLTNSGDFERYLRELSTGVAGEVKIGASTSVGTYILPRIMSRLLRRLPKLGISLLTQPRSSVLEAVRRAEVDFGFVLSDRPPDGLTVEFLRAEPLWFVVSPMHALAKRRRLKVADLRTVPFVVGPKDTEYSEMIGRILGDHGLRDYPVAARISNFEGVKELVHGAIGITLMPRFVVQREIRNHGLRRLKVGDFDGRAGIMLVERSQHLATPTVTRVKRMIASAVKRS